MPLNPRANTARSLAEGEEKVGRVDPERIIRLTLHIKPSTDTLSEFAATRARQPLAAWERQKGFEPLTRQQYADAHSLSPADLHRVRQFSKRFGLEVLRDSLAHQLSVTPLAQRTVEVAGAAADVSRAFGVDLLRVRRPDGAIYRTHVGPFSVPSEFDSLIANVFGLDRRPQVSPRSRSSPRLGGTPGGVAYTPVEVGNAYKFPNSATGNGQTIAILELGGGFRRRDLRAYFNGLGLQMPDLRTVNVAGGFNRPTGQPDGPDSEVMLDIEVASAVANGAKIVVYFAPNTSRGFVKGVSAAVHDAVHHPDILSISWGGPEATWSHQDMLSISEVLQAAATMGLSVFTAAGDSGSTDGVRGKRPHADFPAASPYATACGGTSLSTSGSSISEQVWNDSDGGGTGGGISSFFPMPDYQSGNPGVLAHQPSGQPRRGLPDVAGCADPNTGYKVRIDGIDTVYGGTSAVAPLWAGLTALLNESLGKSLGFLNPLLYLTSLKSTLNDVQVGDNDTTGRVGNYRAATGWDPCTGFGTPAGASMLAELTA